MADPFFISCVIISDYEDKDLTTPEGVMGTVNYEISEEHAEMYLTWGEYIHHTVNEVNDKNAKNILLFLSKNNKIYFTPKDLKEKLGLDLEVNEIHKQLIVLKEADLINRGVSNIKYKGLEDGTLNLILRKSFEEEIEGFEPDFKQEFSEKLLNYRRKTNNYRVS
jgi:predicted transport protein